MFVSWKGRAGVRLEIPSVVHLIIIEFGRYVTAVSERPVPFLCSVDSAANETEPAPLKDKEVSEGRHCGDVP